MTLPTPVLDKTRILVASEAFAADADRPTHTDGAKYPAAMRGALIGLAILDVTAINGADSVVVTLQDSDDASSWFDWFAFTSTSAVGKETIDVSTKRAPRRFIQASINVTVAGGRTVTLTVKLQYAQVGPRDELADGVVIRT